MPALWMLLASLLFATMGVCIKMASTHFNPAELILWRGIIGLLLMGWVARLRGVSLKTSIPGMHVWRSTIGVMSLGAWFYAIANLPLATAMTLNYMSSVWIASFLIGGALLAWNPRKGIGASFSQGPLTLSVMVGFVGVVLMLRPSIESHQMFAGLIGLLSGLGSAFAYMQVMALGKSGEPEERTVFYFAGGTLVAGLLSTAFTGFSSWDWQAAVWLVPIGVLASFGQLCMTRAYSRGPTLLVANLQYAGIVFAGIYSVTLFGDHLPWLSWAGMVLIITSGVVATILRARAAPDSPAEEH